MNGKILGYARVSSSGQSLELQLEQLEAAGCEKIFQEKISGSQYNRPELAALLDYAREGDTIISTRIDRVARSTKHLLEIVETLNKRNIDFKVLNTPIDTSSATGELILTMLGAIATFERSLMLERQKEGIQKAKMAGRYKGRTPTARAKAKQVMEMVEHGKTRQAIADKLEIGIASVYRIIKDAKKAA